MCYAEYDLVIVIIDKVFYDVHIKALVLLSILILMLKDVDEDIGDYFIENSECCAERATLMSALTVRTRQLHSLLFSNSIASLSAFIFEFKR